MVVQSSDTDPKSEQILISLIRRSSVPRRLERMGSMSQSVMELSRRAIRRANTTASDGELSELIVRYCYGEPLARDFKRFIDLKRKAHEST